MKIFKFSKKYIYKYKLLFGIFIVTIIFTTGLQFFQTFISGVFIDFLINSNDVKLLYEYSIIFGIVSILGIISNILNGYIGTKIQGLVSYKMSKDIFEHMINLPDSYIKSVDTTYLSQRINTDCNTITSFFIDTFATVYKGNIIKNLIMDCQSYTKYRPNETTGGIFVSWRRKEELPTGA